jgi:hypothetical protein
MGFVAFAPCQQWDIRTSVCTAGGGRSRLVRSVGKVSFDMEKYRCWIVLQKLSTAAANAIPLESTIFPSILPPKGTFSFLDSGERKSQSISMQVKASVYLVACNGYANLVSNSRKLTSKYYR